MKKQIILLIAILFLPLIVVGDDCYTRTRQKAIDAYNRGEYDYAKELFQSAKDDCIETPTNNDLDSWINKCSSAKEQARIDAERIAREQAKYEEEKLKQIQQNTKGQDNKPQITKQYNSYNYVDLGLSVKWATCNVGATKPEEYGYIFAWGEVVRKSKYNWTTYKYCNGTKLTITKYTVQGYKGKVDYKITLDTEDDAAIVNWGDKWRMPTKKEQQELINNCNWTWTTQNGVKGYKVVGPNGNSIFLPAGLRDGENGYYWSCSLYNEDSAEAYYLGFGTGGKTVYHSERQEGYYIRPVINIKEEKLLIDNKTTTTKKEETHQVVNLNKDNSYYITGLIVDNKGIPVIGASIQEKGTTNGTISTFDGDFALRVKKDAILLISAQGYKSEEIKAQDGMLVELKKKK